MLLVQKYGGTSVASPERIKHVAARVARAHRHADGVVVIVSAMAGETDRLTQLARAVDPQVSDHRELDVLLASGEQVSVALLALALARQGAGAVSFLGHQLHVHTDSAFSRARIQQIDTSPLVATIGRRDIPVVAGFQGIDHRGNITTLGRGGSDTSAVAVAASLAATTKQEVVCEIYTDVEGVFTTDPAICPAARLIPRITYDEMLELAALGAKVLQIRSVELAANFGVPLHVRSTFDEGEGTMVSSASRNLEQVVVTGITLDSDQARVTVTDLPQRAGIQSELFLPLTEAGIVIDMIVQNPPSGGRTAVSFTVARADLPRALELLRGRADDLGPATVLEDDSVAKVSIVGVAMRNHSGVAQRMFGLLAREGIEILIISTSEIKVSCLIARRYGELAVRVLHEGFGLHDQRSG